MAQSFDDLLRQMYKNDNEEDDEPAPIQDVANVDLNIVDNFPGPKAPLQTWGVSENPNIPMESPADTIANMDRMTATADNALDNNAFQTDRTNRLQAAIPLAAEAEARGKPTPEEMVQKRIADLVAQRKAERAQRDKLVKDLNNPYSGSSILGNIFAGISGFGAGIRGGDVGSAYRQVKDLADSGKRNALEQFDKQVEEDRRARGEEKEETLFARGERDDADKQRLIRENRDPKSERSQFAQSILLKMMPGLPPEITQRMSAELIAERFPQIKVYIDNEYKKAKDAAAAEERKIDNARADKSLEIQKEGNEARLKLAETQMGISQAANARAAEANERSARAEERAIEAEKGKVENVDTSSGATVNIKDDTEVNRVKNVGTIESLRNRAQKLADDGTIADNVGFINKMLLLGKEKLDMRSPKEAEFARLRDEFNGMLRMDWKTEPNGTIIQSRLSEIAFPKNAGEIPVFLDKVNEILSLADPDGRYREVGAKMRSRSPKPATRNNKTEVKRQFNRKTGQTRIVYSDGSTEVIK